MDRSAVFIDAGYLLAEGGKLCCGSGNRQRLACDFARLIDTVVAACRRSADTPHLRTYWYDAAQNGIPTTEQLEIGALSFVKLRLGRLSGGRQKGVDSLILRDLMVLASTRSISSAYLIAGDEDLREAVVYAQDLGVRVALVGIETSSSPNQAATLVREADEVMTLTRGDLAPYMRNRPLPAQPARQVTAASLVDRARTAAREFAIQWADRATRDELRELLGGAPLLPKPLDRELLFAVQDAVGLLDAQPEVRRSLRVQFWESLRERVASETADDEGAEGQD